MMAPYRPDSRQKNAKNKEYPKLRKERKGKRDGEGRGGQGADRGGTNKTTPSAKSPTTVIPGNLQGCASGEYSLICINVTLASNGYKMKGCFSPLDQKPLDTSFSLLCSPSPLLPLSQLLFWPRRCRCRVSPAK